MLEARGAEAPAKEGAPFITTAAGSRSRFDGEMLTRPRARGNFLSGNERKLRDWAAPGPWKSQAHRAEPRLPSSARKSRHEMLVARKTSRSIENIEANDPRRSLPPRWP